LVEEFAIYGIKVGYLEDWKVYFLSNIERMKGDVAFSPISGRGRGKEWRIVLTWRPLESSRRKYSSVEEQAKETMKQLTKAKQVGSFQIIDHKLMEVNGHGACFYNLLVKYYKRAGLLKTTPSDWTIRFLLLHCTNSERCMILYEESDCAIEKEEVFEDIIRSFSCH